VRRFVTFVLALSLAGLASGQTKPKPRAPQTSTTHPITLAAATLQVHQNTLSWSQSPDAVTGTFSNVYRVAGGCPSTIVVANFTKINTTTTIPASGTYVDTINLVAGTTNSYVVTNVIPVQGVNVESSASNCVTLLTPTFPPQALTGSAQ
jgi:uncharacterized membrane protein YfcA